MMWKRSGKRLAAYNDGWDLYDYVLYVMKPQQKGKKKKKKKGNMSILGHALVGYFYDKRCKIVNNFLILDIHALHLVSYI